MHAERRREGFVSSEREVEVGLGLNLVGSALAASADFRDTALCCGVYADNTVVTASASRGLSGTWRLCDAVRPPSPPAA